MNKKRRKKEYLNNELLNCPFCGQDRPDHSCGNCYSEMSQEDCWKWKGYCSEKCLKYITEELPKTRQGKIDAGINCTCVEPLCAKCLGSNCKEDFCSTHTLKAKNRYRKIKIL